MTDDASTASAEGGEQGSENRNEVVNSIPAEWAESDHFKDYFGEDGNFDFARFSETHTGLMAGRPTVPDSYEFDFPEDSSQYFDEADINLQREMAKEAGLTQAQYEAVVKFDMAQFARQAEQIANETKESRSALVKEWGGEQKFADNMAAATKVAVNLFGEEFTNRLDLGNDPDFIKGLYKLSQKLSEDTLKKGSGVNNNQRPVGVDGEPLFVYDS